MFYLKDFEDLKYLGLDKVHVALLLFLYMHLLLYLLSAH